MIKPSRVRLAGNVVRMGQKKDVYRILVAKPDRKSPQAGPRHWWMDNIKMDLRDIA
jgi:hypothetical protein